MKELFKVDAVHPVAKRILKSNLTKEEKNKLIAELKHAGYYESEINIDVRKIFEIGDEIAIYKEDFDALPDKVDRDKPNWIETQKKFDTKNTIKYIFGNEPKFPLKGKLEFFRLSRDNGHLVVNWENANESLYITSNGTNVYFLEEMGYKFEQPEFDVIAIADADDSLLNTHELIIKYMMLDNDWSEHACESYLKPVTEAMAKAEAVFYQPQDIKIRKDKKMEQAIARHIKITRFLLEINKLMEGIYVEETTENHETFSLIKFQANLTCLYANPSFWSPTPAFFSIIMNAAKKNFREVNDVDDFGWNNTKTVFWIDKEKI